MSRFFYLIDYKRSFAGFSPGSGFLMFTHCFLRICDSGYIDSKYTLVWFRGFSTLKKYN